MKGRILALDPGQRKIGVAISDPTQTLARAVGVWFWGEDFWEKLRAFCEREGVVKIVVGIPIGLRGETEQSTWAREFAEQVRQEIGLEVQEVNEVFTSQIAQANRQHLKKSERAQADDAEAARVLLEGVLR